MKRKADRKVKAKQEKYNKKNTTRKKNNSLRISLPCIVSKLSFNSCTCLSSSVSFLSLSLSSSFNSSYWICNTCIISSDCFSCAIKISKSSRYCFKDSSNDSISFKELSSSICLEFDEFCNCRIWFSRRETFCHIVFC